LDRYYETSLTFEDRAMIRQFHQMKADAEKQLREQRYLSKLSATMPGLEGKASFAASSVGGIATAVVKLRDMQAQINRREHVRRGEAVARLKKEEADKAAELERKVREKEKREEQARNVTLKRLRAQQNGLGLGRSASHHQRHQHTAELLLLDDEDENENENDAGTGTGTGAGKSPAARAAGRAALAATMARTFVEDRGWALAPLGSGSGGDSHTDGGGGGFDFSASIAMQAKTEAVLRGHASTNIEGQRASIITQLKIALGGGSSTGTTAQDTHPRMTTENEEGQAASHHRHHRGSRGGEHEQVGDSELDLVSSMRRSDLSACHGDVERAVREALAFKRRATAIADAKRAQEAFMQQQVGGKIEHIHTHTNNIYWTHLVAVLVLVVAVRY
jgi:hypothetical protein